MSSLISDKLKRILVFFDKDKPFRIGARLSEIELSIYLFQIVVMKKTILQIIVPFLAGCGVLMAFGFPLGQSLVSGIGGSIGLHVGLYIEKLSRTKKVNS